MPSIAAWTRRCAAVLAPALVLALLGGACASPGTMGSAGSLDPSTSSSPGVDRSTATPSESASFPVVETGSSAWLVVGRAGDDGLHVVLSNNGESLYDLPAGVPDDVWGRLVTARTDGAATVVEDRHIQPGTGGASRTVPGAWRLPTIGEDPTPVGVSEDGRTIVLVEAAATGPGRTETRFAILRRSLTGEPRIVTLAGAFDFDAISADGSVLYVVEHLAGPPAAHYQVRALDVATGTLREGAVADKNLLDEAMGGYPISQLRRHDGMVFTLYRGAEHPFIHALSTLDAWALCIDLPPTGADDSTAARDWGLAATPDGTAIVAANGMLGIAARISTNDLNVVRTATFAPMAANGPVARLAKFGHQEPGVADRRVVIGPDGATYVAGTRGIVRLSPDDLTVDGRILDGMAVDAMAVPPDGRSLYALTSDGRITQIAIPTGQVIGTVPGNGYDRLVAITPW
jgi:hypothetical protein